MHFRKMHGLGNDFVILDQRDGHTALMPEFIKHVCDRHMGVGCDQLIVMEPSDKADMFMRVYNPDASQSEACGNATRCVVDLYLKETGLHRCTVETLAGVLTGWGVDDGLVEIDMGPAKSIKDLELSDGGLSNPVAVDMGNPHAVFFTDKVEDVDIEKLGPRFENDEIFPHRANIEFVEVLDKSRLRMRVWERGAGVTLACGSGACAVMAAAVHRGLSNNKITLTLDGGDLTMELRDNGHIFMTGPVAYVFDGTLKNI